MVNVQINAPNGEAEFATENMTLKVAYRWVIVTAGSLQFQVFPECCEDLFDQIGDCNRLSYKKHVSKVCIHPANKGLCFCSKFRFTAVLKGVMQRP